jgi:phosphohistidine swiveling domain-containing protein
VKFHILKRKLIELAGRSANVGKAVGKALVLERFPLPEENIDVSPGDILIVHNLSPDMVVMMFRAGGIVAEVGGVASHAATLARELKIPCVVGVSNATKLIPNDALVEVDGDKGITRIQIEATS